MTSDLNLAKFAFPQLPLATAFPQGEAARGDTDWSFREAWGSCFCSVTDTPSVTLDKSLSDPSVPTGKMRTLILSPSGFRDSLGLFPRTVRRFLTLQLSGIVLQVMRLKAARKAGSYSAEHSVWHTIAVQ